jgi:thioredoxin-related protein
MRRLFTLGFALLICVAANASAAAQQRPTADQLLASATAAAAPQHKHIFLVFGASWCPPCRQLEAFLADKQMRPLIDKHFVVADLRVEEERGKHPELNTPGGDKLRADFGGRDSGVPFIVFLDEHGRPVVNSNRPVKDKAQGENVGYPVLPEEIDWFVTMLHKAVPEMASRDADAVEKWLRNVAASQTP